MTLYGKTLPDPRGLGVRSLLLAIGFAGAVLSLPSDAGSGPAASAVLKPDRLVIVSNTDVKGKTSPCGCHVPKGGFARRETFIDSLQTEYGQLVAVDCGGWFPEGDSSYTDVAQFIAREMVLAHIDAVGTSDRELHFGLGFLQALARDTHLPIVCANLQLRGTGKPVFPPYRLVKTGNITVGVFSLISNTADLGAVRDSVVVEDPVVAAHRTIDAMRAKGASVVVLLSNLGKIESEDLVTAVPGVDAVIVGRNVPLLEQGRTIGTTVASYGGEQGHYVAVTTLMLDGRGRMASGSATTFMLGPDVADKGTTLARVKKFEDAFNEKLRKQERDHAMQSSIPAGVTETSTHFLGAQVCARCHSAEFKQWQTTAHAQAWHTLLAQSKDATPECIQCHALGYKQPGGFATGTDSTKLGSVQCESCHGMGTSHEAWAANKPHVTEAVCRSCHTDTTSPAFQFAMYQPHVLHHVPAVLLALPPRPKSHVSMN